MYYYNKEKINLSDIFKTGIVFAIFGLLLYLNYKLSINFCTFCNIPFDLTISAISIGFGYELTLVITIIETGIISYCISKLIR